MEATRKTSLKPWGKVRLASSSSVSGLLCSSWEPISAASSEVFSVGERSLWRDASSCCGFLLMRPIAMGLKTVIELLFLRCFRGLRSEVIAALNYNPCIKGLLLVRGEMVGRTQLFIRCWILCHNKNQPGGSISHVMRKQTNRVHLLNIHQRFISKV